MFYNYLHTKPNGEVFYIGKGKGNRAWSFYRKNPYWNNIVNKYGKPKVTILAKWEEENKAFEFEKFLIISAKHFNFKLSNKTNGGDGICGMKHSQVTKSKMSTKRSGKNNPMFGVSLSGNKNGMFGKGYLLTKEKNGRFISPILATDIKTNKQFKFIGKQALIDYGFSDTKVYACLNGRRNTHKGHTFKRELQ